MSPHVFIYFLLNAQHQPCLYNCSSTYSRLAECFMSTVLLLWMFASVLRTWSTKNILWRTTMTLFSSIQTTDFFLVRKNHNFLYTIFLSSTLLVLPVTFHFSALTLVRQERLWRTRKTITISLQINFFQGQSICLRIPIFPSPVSLMPFLLTIPFL